MMNANSEKLTCGLNPLYSGNADTNHNLATLRLLVFVLAIFLASTVHAGWNLVTQSAEWSERMEHVVVALPDDSLVLMGGGYFSQPSVMEGMNDVWRSENRGASWTEMEKPEIPDPPFWFWPRHNHAGVVLSDDSIVLMGGNGMNDVWRSQDKGDNWTMMALFADWSGRSAPAAVALPDDSILLLGGLAFEGEKRDYKNDVWRSTDQGATWTQVTANAPWRGREGHVVVDLPDGGIVLMGGSYWHSHEDRGLFNDVWRSQDQGQTWEPMTDDDPWEGQRWFPTDSHAAVVLSDGSIVLVTGNMLNEVWRSTDQGATWSMMAEEVPWPQRLGHAAAILADDTILLMGGHARDSEDFRLMNDIWRFPVHFVTVTLDAQGGIDPVPGSITAIRDAYYGNLPVTSREAHALTGWFTAPEGGTRVTERTMVSAAAQNHTLYAQWAVEGKYPVVYHGNGNTGGMPPTDPNSPYVPDQTVTVLDKADLVRTGYLFSGWNTRADGTGESRQPGDEFTMPEAAVNLYAQWTDGEKLVQERCGTCHGLGRIESASKNRADWEATVDRMIAKQTGLLDEAERGVVVDYLTDKFGPKGAAQPGVLMLLLEEE